ncbi:MAG: DNA-binding transcriptional ArsR family regulator [Myxococcota bacterium]|jgi:DNA-binding transcriptional ArsR family regulator
MVGEIARRAQQRPQVTSSHLRRLAAAGRVHSSASGRERRYALADPLDRFAVSFLAGEGAWNTYVE